MRRFKKILRGASAVLLAAGMLTGGVAATTASAVTTARAATLQTTTDATLPDEHVYRMNAFSAETSDLTYDSNWNKSNGNIIMPKQNGATITWRNAGTWLDTDDVEHKIDARITVVNYGGSMAGVNNPSTDDPSRGIKGWYPKLLSQAKKANVTLRVDLYYDNNGQLGKAVPSTFKGVTGFTWVPYVRGGNSESVINLDSGFTGIGNDLTSDTHTRLVAKDPQYGNNAFKVTDDPSYRSNSEFIDETYFSAAFSGPSIQFTMINLPVSGATNMSGFLVGYRRAVLLNRFYDVDNGKQVRTSKSFSISSLVGSVPQGKLQFYEPEYTFKNDSSLAYLRANYDFVEKDITSTFYNMFSATTDGTNITATVPSDTDTNQPIYLRSYLKKKRTVTYNANGGTGSMTDTKTGEPVTASTFTRKGYRFVGWNTRADGTGQSVNAGDVASFTTDTTLYAQWQVASHTVTFDTNGGNAIAPQTVDDKGKAKEPTAPTRDSWTFAGWYLNGVEYDFATPVTQDITLKAGWKRVAPSMEFKDMHKRISAGSKSGQRKLTLDVKGTGETNKSVTPSDVVILVDETNSMRECADGSSKADSGIQCSTGPSKRDNLGNIIDSAVTSILATNAGRSADQQSRISVIRFAGRNSKYPPKALSQFTTDKNVALPNGWNQGDDLSQTGTDWATALEHVGEAGTTRSNVNKQIILVTDGLASAANEDYIKAGTNANALHQINNPEILKKVVKAYGYANQRTMTVTQSLAKAGWHLRVVGVSADASATALGDSYLAGAYPYVGKDGSIGLYKKGSQPSGYSSQIEWVASVANNAGDSTAIGSDFEATDINDITSTLTSTVITSTTMRNTVISDPLSEWVDPVGLVDGKGTGITVSKDGKPMDSGYTAVYDGSSRTVKVSLPDSLADGSVYSVSFEVALSDKARLNYMQSGTYPDTGDADTGTTSAGKKGYSTNGNATLSWDAVTSTNGTPLIVSHKAKYAKPVASYDSSNVPPVLTNKLPGTGGVASLMPVFIGAGLALALAAAWIVRKHLARLP